AFRGVFERMIEATKPDICPTVNVTLQDILDVLGIGSAILTKTDSNQEVPIEDALVTSDLSLLPVTIDWTEPHNVLLRLDRVSDTTLRITGFIDGNQIISNPAVPFVDYYEISVNTTQHAFGRISLATVPAAGPPGGDGAPTEEAEVAETGEEGEAENVSPVTEVPNCSQDCDPPTTMSEESDDPEPVEVPLPSDPNAPTPSSPQTVGPGQLPSGAITKNYVPSGVFAAAWHSEHFIVDV
ncbi:MAG: hypothetical protein NUW37_12200, partial [Planctomycetes bacterium]|nr:hypothetical protein [Planctomycetota bacterium]